MPNKAMAVTISTSAFSEMLTGALNKLTFQIRITAPAKSNKLRNNFLSETLTGIVWNLVFKFK